MFKNSEHWLRKREKRQDITEDIIEYGIRNSDKIRDRHWEDVWNAITRIPPSGRTLKVVYKTEGKDIKILTAYWID